MVVLAVKVLLRSSNHGQGGGLKLGCSSSKAVHTGLGGESTMNCILSLYRSLEFIRPIFSAKSCIRIIMVAEYDFDK